MAGRKVWAADEILAAADLQSYIQDQVVFVYANASARSSGILSPTEGMVSYLQDTNLLYFFDGSSWVEVAPNVGTAGTYTKVTTDAKGRVTSGTTLSATDVPSLDSGKITSGILDDARIPTLAISKTSGLQSALDGKQPVGNYQTALGFTPVQQGGGSGQGSSKIYIGWKGDSLGCQVDATDVGDIALKGRSAYFGSLYSSSTYNQNNTGRAVFIASDGLFGIGSSSRRFKENIVDADVDIDAVLQIAVRKFNYKKSFDASMPEDIGVIAEELQDLGLTDFVYFDADGVPDGVAYEKLALALIPVVQLQQARLDSFEDRLNKLEKN